MRRRIHTLAGVERRPGDEVEYHHPVYKHAGGIETVPAHKPCHRNLHITRGDFRRWGQMSAQTRRWAFNLKHVRTHPAYDFDRAYYLALYAQ